MIAPPPRRRLRLSMRPVEISTGHPKAKSDQIRVLLSIFQYQEGGRLRERITDQGDPSTLCLIVLEFISVVIFEPPCAGLFIVESAGIFVERYRACGCGRGRGSCRKSFICHRLCPVREVFLVKVLWKAATAMDTLNTPKSVLARTHSSHSATGFAQQGAGNLSGFKCLER